MPIAPVAAGVIPLDLVEGVFVGRRKRFFADVMIAGRAEVAHLPNTGSMATLLTPGVPCWLAAATNPQRQLRWTLVLMGLSPEAHNGFALVDTTMPNRLGAAAIAAGLVPELRNYAEAKREVRWGEHTRFDLCLRGHPRLADAWVEIKNVTMLGAPGRAEFPDAVTARGRAHLEQLIAVVRSGLRAVQWYIVGRSDVTTCAIAHTIDPAYATAVIAARAAGVEFLAWQVELSPTHARLVRALPFALNSAADSSG